MMFVSKFSLPLNTAKNIYLFLPTHAEKEQGFIHLMDTIKCITVTLRAKLIMVVGSQSQKSLQKFLHYDRFFNDVRYMIFEYYPNISTISGGIQTNDLIFAVSARPLTVSFNRRLELLPKILSRHFAEQNYVIIYPEQAEDTEID
ncbi:MAG: hypothetical protein HC905_21395 [Bacteroidales bacterium]|nr:hypothetical protein [Bacteroidales bacterium]